MMAKRMKTLELHYPVIQFLIIIDITMQCKVLCDNVHVAGMVTLYILLSPHFISIQLIKSFCLFPWLDVCNKCRES